MIFLFVFTVPQIIPSAAKFHLMTLEMLYVYLQTWETFPCLEVKETCVGNHAWFQSRSCFTGLSVLASVRVYQISLSSRFNMLHFFVAFLLPSIFLFQIGLVGSNQAGSYIKCIRSSAFQTEWALNCVLSQWIFLESKVQWKITEVIYTKSKHFFLLDAGGASFKWLSCNMWCHQMLCKMVNHQVTYAFNYLMGMLSQCL